MLHFHFHVHLKSGVDGREFCDSVREFMSFLYERELIEGFNIARREFAIDPPNLGEYHIVVDFADSTQMNNAFARVEPRNSETGEFHKLVTDSVRDMTIALYRDFPQPRKAKHIPQ